MANACTERKIRLSYPQCRTHTILSQKDNGCEWKIEIKWETAAGKTTYANKSNTQKGSTMRRHANCWNESFRRNKRDFWIQFADSLLLFGNKIQVVASNVAVFPLSRTHQVSLSLALLSSSACGTVKQCTKNTKTKRLKESVFIGISFQPQQRHTNIYIFNVLRYEWMIPAATHNSP